MADKKSESPVIDAEVVTDASPVIKQPKTLKFGVATEEVLAGKKVTKLEWANTQIYGYLSPITKHLTLHKDDGKDYDWIVNDGDLAGTDFIVLEQTVN
jgi:hypothetical protein